MKIHHLKFLYLLVLASLGALPLHGNGFQIHDGDRVVFLGDSITEQRLYTTYIEAYTLARYPKWNLTFRNTGWGGDTSWLRQRAHPDEKQLFAANPEEQQKMVTDSVARGLSRDVLPLKPTFVTVKFGMNDHAYVKFREDIFRAYVRSQTEIAKDLDANGARVAFLTPQPIEEKRADPDKDERNQSLRQFSDGLKEVASKSGSVFVDQFAPYMDMLLRERTNNPSYTIGAGDAVHPGPTGHTVMAWAILKGLGASAEVSSAKIDAASYKGSTQQGCKVSNVKASEGGLSFDRIDDALPMPIDERAEASLKLAPIANDLSQLNLIVDGLAAGNYQVSIDGEAAAKVSADDLAKGWNYSNVQGPITKQCREILKMVFDKNNLFYHRWRDIQLHVFPDWAQGPEIEARRTAEIARLDKEIGEMEGRIDAIRQPKLHHFELKLVKE